MSEKCYDVVVIGSGAAGMSAALFLKRANLNCCIIESFAPGGQLLKSTVVENYPAIQKTTGPELAMAMYNQIKNLGIEFILANVENIKIEGDLKTIVTNNGNIETENIIISTGRSPRLLNIPNEKELVGHGISYCAICDGTLYKDKKVVVIGGGDSALESAIYLSSLAKEVIIINKNDNFKSRGQLLDNLKYVDNIKCLYNTNVIEFISDGKVLKGVKTNNEVIECDGCFIFIGYIPANDSFKDLGIIDEDGYIEVNNSMQTNIKGIYAAGDVIKKDVFQITTAVSDGTVAATSIIKKYLS